MCTYTSFTRVLGATLVAKAIAANITPPVLTIQTYLLTTTAVELIPILPPSTTTTSAAAVSPIAALTQEGSNTALVGLGVGILLLVLCACCLLILGLLKRNRDQKDNKKEENIVVEDNAMKVQDEPAPQMFFIGDKDNEWEEFYMGD